MFDVLPPNQNAAGGAKPNSMKRRRRAVVSSSRKPPQRKPGNPQVTAGSRVVQVDWKLPARLRKPIRDQLAKERQKKRQRQSIIKFDRRPIHTRPVVSYQETEEPIQGGFTLPRHRLFNRGAEHHTGDVYTKSQPQLQIAAPPYIGNIASKTTGANRPKRALAPKPAPRRKQPVSTKEVVQRKPAPRPKKAPTPARSITRPKPQYGNASATDWYSERDVSYDFGKQPQPAQSPKSLFVEVDEERTVSVRKPQSKFALPLMVSLWPFSMFGAKEEGAKTSKKKVHKTPRSVKVTNLVILLVGCGLVAGLVWNLQGLGRVSAVLALVQGRSQEALGHIGSAQAALAQTDAAASEASFQQAAVLIEEAQTELENALAAQGAILRILDITGTVKSGQELLVVGQSLTAAGQSISRGLTPLLSAGAMVGGTDENTLTIADAIASVRPDFEAALRELETAQRALEKVNSPLLPSDVKEQVQTLRESVPTATELVRTFVEQSDTFLYLLGAEHDRQYLLLFANNHELRPIGGFIGTVGLVNIDRGRVENIDVQSVYDPDGQLRERIAPPSPLLPIVDRWYLRDANWFVDYEVSAPKIAQFFEKEGGPTVDGVILFTPRVIQRLLAITGPVIVPGYEVEVNAENFFEVTQQEVTYDYDVQLNKPKQFLADLAPLLLNRLFESQEGSPPNVEIMGALSEAIYHKDLLLYFRDSAAQEQIQQLGWSGSVPQDKQGFLYVNNANIGGHKSDQFVDQEIDYRSTVAHNGDVEVVLTIRRTHNGPAEVLDIEYPESENPAYKDNVVYQRVFVPRDAQLLEASGFTPAAQVPRPVLHASDLPLEGDADVADWQASQRQHDSGTVIGLESGYTYFSNWIITQPGQTSVTLYRYRIPRHVSMPSIFNAAEGYSVFVAKQPGDVRTSIRASVRVPELVVLTHIAPEAGLTRESDQSVIYRTQLDADTQLGVVMEKN
ncbi:MAG: DUF4012 domain-containing protein [Candidatus Andersenbacteria bacterium]